MADDKRDGVPSPRVVDFQGIAHPPPERCHGHVADMSAQMMDFAAQTHRDKQRPPVLLEHRSEERRVGKEC